MMYGWRKRVPGGKGFGRGRRTIVFSGKNLE